MAFHIQQESQVSSTQDRTIWRRNTDESRSVSDASELESLPNEIDRPIRPYDYDIKFPWLHPYSIKCSEYINSHIDIPSLNDFVKEFVANIIADVNDNGCLRKPSRAAKLKIVVSNYLVFFHTIYLNVKEPLDNVPYLNKISDLLAMFIDLEIKAFIQKRNGIRATSGKLTIALFVFLRYSMDHILDTLLKTRLMIKSSMEISEPVLRRVLRDKPLQPVCEMTYVRYILVYKLWKNTVKTKEEKRKISEQAIEFIPPPRDFKRNAKPGLVGDILPAIPKLCSNITKFLVQAEFNVKEKATMFLQRINDPQSASRLFVPNVISDLETASSLLENSIIGLRDDDQACDLSEGMETLDEIFNELSFDHYSDIRLDEYSDSSSSHSVRNSPTREQQTTPEISRTKTTSNSSLNNGSDCSSKSSNSSLKKLNRNKKLLKRKILKLNSIKGRSVINKEAQKKKKSKKLLRLKNKSFISNMSRKTLGKKISNNNNENRFNTLLSSVDSLGTVKVSENTNLVGVRSIIEEDSIETDSSLMNLQDNSDEATVLKPNRDHSSTAVCSVEDGLSKITLDDVIKDEDCEEVDKRTENEVIPICLPPNNNVNLENEKINNSIAEPDSASVRNRIETNIDLMVGTTENNEVETSVEVENDQNKNSVIIFVPDGTRIENENAESSCSNDVKNEVNQTTVQNDDDDDVVFVMEMSRNEKGELVPTETKVESSTDDVKNENGCNNQGVDSDDDDVIFVENSPSNENNQLDSSASTSVNTFSAMNVISQNSTNEPTTLVNPLMVDFDYLSPHPRDGSFLSGDGLLGGGVDSEYAALYPLDLELFSENGGDDWDTMFLENDVQRGEAVISGRDDVCLAESALVNTTEGRTVYPRKKTYLENLGLTTSRKKMPDDVNPQTTDNHFIDDETSSPDEPLMSDNSPNTSTETQEESPTSSTNSDAVPESFTANSPKNKESKKCFVSISRTIVHDQLLKNTPECSSLSAKKCKRKLNTSDNTEDIIPSKRPVFQVDSPSSSGRNHVEEMETQEIASIEEDITIPATSSAVTKSNISKSNRDSKEKNESRTSSPSSKGKSSSRSSSRKASDVTDQPQPTPTSPLALKPEKPTKKSKEVEKKKHASEKESKTDDKKRSKSAKQDSTNDSANTGVSSSNTSSSGSSSNRKSSHKKKRDNEVHSTKASGQSSSSEVKAEDSTLNECIMCKYVRIGTYKAVPSTQIVVSPKTVDITVPTVNNSNVNTKLSIKCSQIVKVNAFYGRDNAAVIFIMCTAATASTIREVLKMSNRGKIYYDPVSKVELHKQIMLFSEKLTSESKSKIKLILNNVTKNLYNELNNKDVTEVLKHFLPTDEVHGVVKKLGLPPLASAPKPRKIFVQNILNYPSLPVDSNINITSEDYATLADGCPISENIIDFGLMYMFQKELSEKDRARTYIFSTNFYKKLTTDVTSSKTALDYDVSSTSAEKRHSRVKRWTKAVNIFTKDFIIIPICENHNWFIVVICFPRLSEIVKSSDYMPSSTVSKLKRKHPEDHAHTSSKVTRVTRSVESEDDSTEHDTESSDEQTLYSKKLNNASKKSKSVEKGSNKNNSTSCKSLNKSASSDQVKQPCILIFDSVSSVNRTKAVSVLRDYLHLEYRSNYGRDRDFSQVVMKCTSLKIPQLPPTSDCDSGVHILHYINAFCKNPITDYRFPISPHQKWLSSSFRQTRLYIVRSLQKSMVEQGVVVKSLNLPDLESLKLTDQSDTEQIDMKSDNESYQETSEAEVDEEFKESKSSRCTRSAKQPRRKTTAGKSKTTNKSGIKSTSRSSLKQHDKGSSKKDNAAVSPSRKETTATPPTKNRRGPKSKDEVSALLESQSLPRRTTKKTTL